MKAILLLLLLTSPAFGVEPTDWPYCCCCEVQCGSAGGSATLVGVSGNRGIALTAAHVVEAGNSVSMRFNDGYKCTGKVIGRDTESDLAAIELPVKPGMRTPKCVRAAKKSDGVFLAVGFPFYCRDKPHFTTGKFLGYSGSDVQFAAHPFLHSGFSGGALFAPDGSYVGSTNGYGESYSFAASGPALEKFAARWMEVGK